jgi:hypothetical protein
MFRYMNWAAPAGVVLWLVTFTVMALLKVNLPGNSGTYLTLGLVFGPVVGGLVVGALRQGR